MNTRQLVCLIVGLAFLGCGKSAPREAAPKESSSKELPLASAPADSAPIPPPPSSAGTATSAAPNVSTSEGDEPGLAELNRAIGAYVMGQLKSPASLEDLVKAGMIKKVPTAPLGKKYALDPTKTKVLLVDR